MNVDNGRFSGDVLLASVRICLLGAVLAGVAIGQETMTQNVGFGELVELRSEEPCLWDARDPLTLDMKQYAVVDTADDIDYVALFYSGTKARTVVVDASRNGPVIPSKDRHIIVVGNGGDPDEPDPPDPPDPPDDWPTTTYDVGPELAATFGNKEAVAQIFQDAADTMVRTRNATEVRRVLNNKLLPLAGEASYLRYFNLFRERFDENRIRTVTQHAAAYREIAEWIRKR